MPHYNQEEDNEESHIELLKIIKCIAEAENLTAELYRIIARYLPHYISGLLLHIARESENHGKSLKSLGELVNCEQCGRVECDSEAVNKLKRKLEEVRQAEREGVLSKKSLLDLFEYLVGVVEFASEEYYVMVVMPLLKKLLKESGIPVSFAELWSIVLDEISQEEKFHARIAESIREYLEIYLS